MGRILAPYGFIFKTCFIFLKLPCGRRHSLIHGVDIDLKSSHVNHGASERTGNNLHWHQAAGADLLFPSLLLLLLLLLCKPLGRAAPRMVYGDARIPPWRCAPRLAHV